MTITLNKVKVKYKITVSNDPSIKIGKAEFKPNSTYVFKRNKTMTVTISGKAKTVNNAYTTTKAKVAKVVSSKTASAVKIKGIGTGKATITIKVNGYKTFKIKVKIK